MRKVKIIQVDGRGEVTVKEVSPLAVCQAWNAESRFGELEAILSESVQPFNEVKTWYASEIEQVVDAWLAVNDSFFGIAAKLKVDGIVKELLAAVTNSLPDVFADLLRQAIPGPGTMGGRPS